MSRTIPAARRGGPAAAPLPQRKNSLSLRLKRISRAWQLYVLLAPAVIYILVFKYWPMYGVQIAFKNYNPVDGFTDSPWVGLTHFIRFINSYQFGQVVGNTLWIAILGLLIAFPIPIILALLVNQLQSEKFKKFTQTVLYSPAFISTVVVVGIMFVLLSPRSGLVNNAIQLGGGEPIFFMGSAEWFRPVYVISDVWQNAGFSMIVYLAALAAIDPALHDAAKVDGASKLQRIRHIDLPGIMPVVTILFILAIGNLLNVGFEKALLMQTPLNISSSEIIQTYVYHAGLQQAQFSYSAAIGLFNSLLNLALLLVFNTIARRANQATLW
ncbi:putative aldouronate transport system permease protein [Arthrobacter ulcerisalmonis]|nr:ABC transporter permease subunit [Arthrobacter ulcerisalmonis]MDQ0662504.1 putative aldouronate transport system permease protein [Arthrobacter ulcerisalmonis]